LGITDRRPAPGPLPLHGTLQETIWGGRNLAHMANRNLPDGVAIGESWETALESVVARGPWRGRTLGALTQTYDELLVGSRAVEVFGHRFPLLAKFLDAQQQLSVQVHPDDAYAAQHEGGKLGKTEMWYVLHAEPGARLVYGLSRVCTMAEVRQAIAQSRLEELLFTFEARRGDVIFVPAGVVHAIGGGIALYELQEYSDVTYRLYDYGRRQADGSLRELHVDKGLAVMRYEAAKAARATPVALGMAGGDGSRRVLVASRYFVVEELRFSGQVHELVDGSTCHILSVLDGACDVRAHGHEEVRLGRGDTIVVPACLGAYTLSGVHAQVVRSYVPRADDSLVQRWRTAQASASFE
jgi:mannose-6-phosphate isomerase